MFVNKLWLGHDRESFLIIAIILSQLLPSKHFLFSKTSWKRLEDVFSVTIFCLPRRLQEFFKASSRQVCKTSSKDVIKMFSRVFARRLLQDVIRKTSCNYVLKMSWRRRRRRKIVTLKTSSRPLQYVFTKTNICWVISFLRCFFWNEVYYLEAALSISVTKFFVLVGHENWPRKKIAFVACLFGSGLNHGHWFIFSKSLLSSEETR